jgi:hypothetical protein
MCTLCLPAVAGDEPIGAVGAGDGGHAARAVVVAGVVADGGRAGQGSDGEEGDGGGELHFGEMR